MRGVITIDHDDYYPFEFEAVIEYHSIGNYRYTVVFLDERLHAHLPLIEYPRLRASGEVRDIPFEGAWQPVRGRWYLMLSKLLMRDGEFEIGSVVRVRFRVEDQEAVDLSAELQAMLNENTDLKRAWNALTAGKRRGLAYRVSSAKTVLTNKKRLAEIADVLIGSVDRS
ncbi:MAG: YdeI/OmpD-associated family protein [Planctomycetota bacterium]